jgi:phosphohistidine phosphatase
MLSSPAVRALATAKLFAKELDYKTKDIVVDDRLYASSADDLLEVIHEVDDVHKRVMVFGHNPEMSELAHRLSDKISDMPTCAVAEFEFDAKSWSSVGRQAPDQASLHEPK